MDHPENEIDAITDALLNVYRKHGMKVTELSLQAAVSHFAHESIEPLDDMGEIEWRIEQLANAIINTYDHTTHTRSLENRGFRLAHNRRPSYQI